MIVPHLADQFYWGKRVEELGVGLPMIPRGRLTVGGLSAGIQGLIDKPVLRDNASLLKQVVCSETGIESAVQLIEEHFG